MRLCVPWIYDVVEIPERYVEVQTRKHRKKRINKKWRKRYGVKRVPDLSCYLYENNGVIKILAPPRAAQKSRDDIGLMNIGVIDRLQFRVAGTVDNTEKRFNYLGGE